MLQAIRERAQGWIAWAIVILISIPFALWGVQEYLGTGSEPVVASVGDREITQRELDTGFQRFRIDLRERLGDAYDPAMFDDRELRRQVLDSMVRREVILQSALDLGMRAGDDLVRSTIAGIPAFQSNGGFDRDAYERSLQYQGLTPSMFEQRIRASIISDQLASAIRGTAFLTPAEAAELRRLRSQQRDLSYLVLRADEHRPDEPPSEAAIQAYYDEHRDELVAPERVKLAYLELDVERLAEALDPDEAALREYFELHREEFVAPEQRRARHILISTGDATEAEARERARGLLERLKAGESFGQLAREASDDPGSAAQGGDLGWFERGVMDPAFEEVVFAMESGEVEGPVKTPFGLHIIELTDVRRQEADFESMREQVRRAYTRRESERLYYEYVERLGNLTYEQPDSLEPAAEALGLEVQRSGWVTREGGPGPLASPKVIRAAFSDDVLVQRYNSEPIELGPEHVLVLRVVDHQAERLKTLDEVRDEIARRLQDQRAAERTRDKGRELLDRLRGGASLEAVAGETAGSWDRPGLVRRDAGSVPQAVLDSAFRLPRPPGGGSSYGGAQLSGGDFALVAVAEVVDGEAEAQQDPRAGNYVAGVARSLGESRLDDYVEYLRSRTPIEIRLDQER